MSRNYVFVQRGIRAVKLRHMLISVSLHADTGVILFGEAIQANQSLVPAAIKGCQVRYWIVGKLGIRISRILYHMYVKGLKM